MTPSDFRSICDSLNPGGQAKLARMLPGREPGQGVNPRTVRRWLRRKKEIPPWVDAAIKQLQAEGKVRRLKINLRKGKG